MFDIQAKDLVVEHYCAIDKQLWDQQEAMIDHDFRAILAGADPCPFSEWLEKLKQFYIGIPDGNHDLHFYNADGGRVVSIGRFNGRHDGVLFGIEPTGKKISMAVLHVDRVFDGKIVEHIAQSDLAGLLAQIQ